MNGLKTVRLIMRFFNMLVFTQLKKITQIGLIIGQITAKFLLHNYGVVAVVPIVELLLVCVCATVGKFSVLTAKKKSSAQVVMKPCILMMKPTVLILILRVQGARNECNRTIRKNKILVKSG